MYYLTLEDGSTYTGTGFGAYKPAYGELVFTTSMTGYLESITDPSYRGQILIFAFPTIANYPLNKGKMESGIPHVAGIVTKDSHSEIPVGGFSGELSAFLGSAGVPGIDGIETRGLVSKIREKGSMRAWISQSDGKKDFSKDPFAEDLIFPTVEHSIMNVRKRDFDKKILFINAGSKISVIDNMADLADLTVVPYDMEVPDKRYDAIFISNGPGNPESPHLQRVVKYVRSMIGQTRIYGICLGQQIIALAYGASTYKMHFGHRGSNHAVTDGKNIRITTHNHGFAVDRASAEARGLKVVEWDVNDGTPEKLEDPENRVRCVQYHPEASPGPHDTLGFFEGIKKELNA
jgi:carbamoyl-phosphate synthase small subunit